MKLKKKTKQNNDSWKKEKERKTKKKRSIFCLRKWKKDKMQNSLAWAEPYISGKNQRQIILGKWKATNYYEPTMYKNGK